ncbi:hypothetical protein QBC34DRAFT_91104 [Podospora aff. communis PSN243]|uniref:Uncharacterized protein n=1 Tax=Podospora aff. communis PSN243 TaxID=3040156 RepID=A0AAV9GMP2_9PEZI|nr:hypothetical protein QBC34DRAFT_91104 [Podospora aff. communis PSN243]
MISILWYHAFCNTWIPLFYPPLQSINGHVHPPTCRTGSTTPSPLTTTKQPSTQQSLKRPPWVHGQPPKGSSQKAWNAVGTTLCWRARQKSSQGTSSTQNIEAIATANPANSKATFDTIECKPPASPHLPSVTTPREHAAPLSEGGRGKPQNPTHRLRHEVVSHRLPGSGESLGRSSLFPHQSLNFPSPLHYTRTGHRLGAACMTDMRARAWRQRTLASTQNVFFASNLLLWGWQGGIAGLLVVFPPPGSRAPRSPRRAFDPDPERPPWPSTPDSQPDVGRQTENSSAPPPGISFVCLSQFPASLLSARR